jgi:hypothetical protein
VRWLNRAYEHFTWPGEPADAKPSCVFQLASSQDLIDKPKFTPGVVFFLYRVKPDEHARHTPPGGRAGRGRPPLSLNLHYLMFPWAEGAREEAYLLAWTMRMLESTPVLGPGDLAGSAFSPDEAVQIVPGELSNEDLMRIWDAIDPPYRVSVPYVARVVQIDLEPLPEEKPVVTRKLVFETIDAPRPAEGGDS